MSQGGTLIEISAMNVFPLSSVFFYSKESNLNRKVKSKLNGRVTALLIGSYSSLLLHVDPNHLSLLDGMLEEKTSYKCAYLNYFIII